jgi:hypothetical protein
MTLLVSAGSEKFGPLGNVLGALKKQGSKIDAVWLIDTKDTALSFGSHAIEIKKALDREDVMIASLEVTEQNAAERIPEFMADYVLRNKSLRKDKDSLDKTNKTAYSNDGNWREDVIVDLTAGPKFITSTLYAAANFCRVRRVYYFLLKSREKSALSFAELTENDYEYLELPPFSTESLLKLSRRSYLQIVYYMKEIEELAKLYQQNNIAFADRIEQSLHFAARGFFDEDFEGGIRSVSTLLEAWSEHVYNFCEKHRETYGLNLEQLTGKGRTWNNYNSKLQQLFKGMVELQNDQQHPSYSMEFVNSALSIVFAVEFVEVVRKLRNTASHSINRRYQATEADANLAINIAISTMKRSQGTIFFQQQNDENL